ncbi:MAG: hypothetical protein HN348_13310 [Proteobacteria bacterium]|nr:hypothetical protein [Pseudomonadota bacterium]
MVIVVTSLTMVWVLIRMVMSMMLCSCSGVFYAIALVTSVVAFVLVVVAAAQPPRATPKEV